MARGRARGLGVVAVIAIAGMAIAERDARAQDASGGEEGNGAQTSQASTIDPAQEAKQQYGAGAEAYAAKRFVEAALHFEAAAAHRPHAAALYNAALAWEQANRPERAADDFTRALGVPGLSAAQMQNARGRVATLERTMGTLDVAAPEGWRVQLDANTDAPAPTRLHAAPGVHTLTIVTPDAPIRHRDVTLEIAKTTHIDLSGEPPPPAATPAPVASAPPTTIETKAEAEPREAAHDWWTLRRGLGVGAIGFGAALLASGVILGTSALDAKDAFNAAPTQAAYDHANSLATWTDVTLIAGAAIAAGGAALVLWPTKKSDAAAGAPAVSLVPTPNGAIVRGVF